MNASLVRSSCATALVTLALSLKGSTAFYQAHPDPALLKLRQQAWLDWENGAIKQAADTYRKAYRIAISERDIRSATVILNNIGSMEFALLDFKRAINSFLEARRLAEQQLDSDDLAVIGFNLAGLYVELGDGEAADRAAQLALKALGDRDPAHQKCLLVGILGKVGALQKRWGPAVAYFQQAIELTPPNDKRVLARGWQSLGEAQLDAGDVSAADKSLGAALDLRIHSHDPYLALTYERLSEVKLAQHDPTAAAKLLSLAIAAPKKDAEIPLWPIYLLRGRIFLELGRHEEALNWFQRSIQSTIEWREEVAPSDALRGSAGTLTRHVDQPYTLFIETSLAVHPDTAMEAFVVTEEYRASALRQTLTATQAWRERLPPEYRQTLKSFREALFEQFANDTDASRRAAGTFQQKLMEMEATADLSPKRTSSIKTFERTNARIALRDIQRGLTKEETLLSLYAGVRRSALWAVTDKHIEVHMLPPSGSLKGAASRFRTAVEKSSSNRDTLGEELYGQLFRGLSPVVESRLFWLVTAPDELFDIPMAALVTARKDGKPVYLIQKHATERIPSALMLRDSSPPLLDGVFVGVADGIYNVADPRWAQPRRTSFLGLNLPTKRVKPSLELTRLVGSAEEIDKCAQKWAGIQPPVLLTGPQATRERFELALRAKPAAIHLAAHMLNVPDKPEDALIALGLSRDAKPEGLTSDDIASFHVPGALVVMNGCASAGAPAVSGKGVMGLTRAWIKAGAHTVIGTRWPIPDDTGELFQLFYANWKNSRARGTPRRIAAESLQSAQRTVLDSNTWRSDPKYWSAFYVVEKD